MDESLSPLWSHSKKGKSWYGDHLRLWVGVVQMYRLESCQDDAFDELSLTSGTPGKGIPRVTPHQVAIQLGLEVARYIPGVKGVVGLPGKIIGKVFGFGKKKKKKAKKARRAAAFAQQAQQAALDKAVKAAVYNDCVQGKKAYGHSLPKAKVPKQVLQQYDRLFQACLHAREDCLYGSPKGTRALKTPNPDYLPPEKARKPFGREEAKRWMKKYDKDYQKYYRTCLETEKAGGKEVSPLLLIGVAGLAFLAFRGIKK